MTAGECRLRFIAPSNEQPRDPLFSLSSLLVCEVGWEENKAGNHFKSTGGGQEPKKKDDTSVR